LGIVYFVIDSQTLLITIGWILFIGYVTFVILGHLYKIVPFLVWYQRFSPLIGKQKVPMLADMVPVKSAKFQFFFTTTGLIVGAVALFMGSNDIFKASISFLLLGSIFMIKDLIYMINFK